MESRKRINGKVLRSMYAAAMFSLMLAFSFFLASTGDAKTLRTPPKIVTGVVQEVGTGALTVNRDRYDISQAVIVTVEGRKTSLSYIKPGDRVELVIEEGDVIKVRVDNRKIVK